MIERFKPTWMVNNIYHVSPQRLKEHGIKTVFSDLDNTLLAWNHKQGSLALKQLRQRFRRHHLQLVVISNNTHHRVAKALAGLNLQFIDWALKPLPWGILRALKRYHLRKDQVVMVGDQLLTDIWSANNARIKSIWVKPLVNTDKWNTRINRHLERRISVRLRRKYKSLDWQEDINE